MNLVQGFFGEIFSSRVFGFKGFGRRSRPKKIGESEEKEGWRRREKRGKEKERGRREKEKEKERERKEKGKGGEAKRKKLIEGS